MKLEVLHVPNCVNLAPMLGHLRQVTDLTVVTHKVATEDEAIARGMPGSPTLLVDGVDPVADQSPHIGVACRINWTDDGQMTSVPSMAQLRAALGPPDPTARC